MKLIPALSVFLLSLNLNANENFSAEKTTLSGDDLSKYYELDASSGEKGVYGLPRALIKKILMDQLNLSQVELQKSMMTLGGLHGELTHKYDYASFDLILNGVEKSTGKIIDSISIDEVWEREDRFNPLRVCEMDYVLTSRRLFKKEYVDLEFKCLGKEFSVHISDL